MNWVKRIIIEWAMRPSPARTDCSTTRPWPVMAGWPTGDNHDEYSYEGTISFRLSPAVGGRILTVTSISPSKNPSCSPFENRVAYVIPSGEDIGERIAKIINLELMR